MQDYPCPPEYLPEKRGNRLGRLAELGEHEHLLLLGSDHFRELAQAREFPALGFDPRTVAEPLRWMMADLLEAHQERQYDAFAPHGLRPIEGLRQFLYRPLVKRRLRGAQVTKRFHLGFVGQIGDHRLVGLEAPQDIRAHELAQRSVGFCFSEAPHVAPERLTGAQQTGMSEVENRPQI